MSSIETLMVAGGRFQQNAWLVWDSSSLDAVVVDPGEEVEGLLTAIGQRNLKVGEIWLTHAHLDHIWGVTPLREATAAPVLMHADDLRWYHRFVEQGNMFGIRGLKPLAPPDALIKHGQQLRVGSTSFEVRHVPGHAPGHVAFIGAGLAISGDVLFHDSIGRTDLAGGDHEQLLASIRNEMLTLPDSTRVLPGHGPETSIGRERQHNPWLNPISAGE